MVAETEAGPAHVLVADDEVHTRLSLSLILRKGGFRVTAVQDGLEALHRLLSEQERDRGFDLLVLDVQMPGLTGTELLEQIETLNLSVPILLISGYSDRDMVDLLERKGSIAYAEKPFSPGEFLAHVRGILDRPLHGMPDAPSAVVKQREDLPHARDGRTV